MKFTKEQMTEIVEDGTLHDGETLLYTVVSEVLLDVNDGDDFADTQYVIKEISTGDFYQATLRQSDDPGQDDLNVEIDWQKFTTKPPKDPGF